jgi:sortase A
LSLCIQVTGEIIITLGIVLALFVAWQLWWTNVETSNHQKLAIESFFAETKKEPKLPEIPEASNSTNGSETLESSVIPDTGDILGIMYIPRFGADYTRPIIQGTSSAQLDTLGLGHYTDTALPGEVGNFAVAGHRQTHGAVFDNIDTLVPGDKIYVQTKDGYFTYVFESREIVLPENSGVLLPVPHEPTVKPTERLLTMTTCHPRFGSEQRFIAYSKLEEKRSMAEGPPDEIKNQVKKASGEN